MKPPDLEKLMQQAQEMQSRMTRFQSELANRRFEAASGGDMVTVVVSGQLRVLEIRIDDGLFASGDKDMIQDLTAAAINAALLKAQQYVQEQMQQLSMGAGIGMPNLMGSSGDSAQ